MDTKEELIFYFKHLKSNEKIKKKYISKIFLSSKQRKSYITFMRSLLQNSEYGDNTNTWALATEMMDLALSNMNIFCLNVKKNKYVFLGTCISLASKFKNVYFLDPQEIALSCNCNVKELIEMEKLILSKGLHFNAKITTLHEYIDLIIHLFLKKGHNECIMFHIKQHAYWIAQIIYENYNYLIVPTSLKAVCLVYIAMKDEYMLKSFSFIYDSFFSLHYLYSNQEIIKCLKKMTKDYQGL